MSVTPDAERMRFEMTRRGWSASDLARAARISPATVSAALAGRRVASRSLACIAHALAKAPVIEWRRQLWAATCFLRRPSNLGYGMLGRLLRARGPVIVTVTVAATALGLGAFLGVKHLSADVPVPVGLPTISSQVFAVAGMTLTSPSPGTYPIDRGEAVLTASASFRGGAVVDARLVHLVNSYRRPVVVADCWAVSFVGNTPPSIGPHGATPLPQAKYLVVFVDASKGNVVDALAN